MDDRTPTRRYRPADVDAVIARAFDIDEGSRQAEGLTADQVRSVAVEMGVAPEALEASLAEHEMGLLTGPPTMAGLLGPSRVAAVRTIGTDPARAAHRLAFELERRGLEADGGDGPNRRWSQRIGWWPDLHRITAVTTVEATVSAHPHGSLVRMEANLEPARRAHTLLAALSMAAALLVPGLVPVVMVLPALAAALGGGPLLAAISFRRRARAIEDRLDGLLGGLG